MNEHEIERLRESLRSLARETEKSTRAPAAIEEALLRQFRRHHARRRLWRSVKIGWVAACLIALLGSGTVALRKAIPVPDEAPAQGRVARTPPPSLPETAAPAMAPPAAARKTARKRMAQPRPAVAQLAARREVMTGFLPVGYGAELGPGEQATLVRVRLPRSALASFGLPFNENRSLQTVNADVLLGEDGLARAIRFVQ